MRESCLIPDSSVGLWVKNRVSDKEKVLKRKRRKKNNSKTIPFRGDDGRRIFLLSFLGSSFSRCKLAKEVAAPAQPR
jgi:hypothetical protein